MLNILANSWSPYIVGVAIGILSCLSFIISQKPLGTSTAYARSSGMLGKTCCGKLIDSLSYYKRYEPEIEWQWMLVLGIIIGSFISAIMSGEFSITFLPPTEYASLLNQSIGGRIFSSLAGGVLVGFGARWANGCTSGHGISGTLQLSIISWISVICFFLGGVITALIIF